jgi:hypothetical protein
MVRQTRTRSTDRAHAGLQRLRSSGETVEQAAHQAGEAAADRPGAAEQEE